MNTVWIVMPILIVILLVYVAVIRKRQQHPLL